MIMRNRRVGTETPKFVWIGASFALLFLSLPLVGLLQRVFEIGVYAGHGGREGVAGRARVLAR